MSLLKLIASTTAVIAMLSLASCGESTDGRKGNRKPALDSKQSLSDGKSGPNAGSLDGAKGSDDDFAKVPVNPGHEPYPFPGQNPGQKPGQNPGHKPGPGPLPGPDHGGPIPCGQQGIACHPGQGGPSQFPPVDINGKPVDHGTIAACLDSFAQMGTPVHGSWAVEAREIKQVSVLSDSVFEDRSVGPRIIILKDVNVLGSKHYRFLNPQALYCVKSVSVLQENRITSCWSNNVVFANNVNVFVRTDSQIVNCR